MNQTKIRWSKLPEANNVEIGNDLQFAFNTGDGQTKRKAWNELKLYLPDGRNVVEYATGATSSAIAENKQILVVDANAGVFTVDLPIATSSANFQIGVKKIDSSGNAVVIDANGTETIDGSPTKSLSSQYESITLFCTGKEWIIL